MNRFVVIKLFYKIDLPIKKERSQCFAAKRRYVTHRQTHTTGEHANRLFQKQPKQKHNAPFQMFL